MWMTALLGFLGGVMLANGVPHFWRGIVGERYPMLFGDSPGRNVVAGWASGVVGMTLLLLAHPGERPWSVSAAVAVGVLPMALFHASGGASWLSRRVTGS